jgi:hypothetical protein
MVDEIVVPDEVVSDEPVKIEVTAVRSTWKRGKGKHNDPSMLFNSREKYDILGFYAKSLYLCDDGLLGKHYLHEIFNKDTFLGKEIALKEIFKMSLRRQDKIASINDSVLLSDIDREARLITEFAQIGVTLTFVD